MAEAERTITPTVRWFDYLPTNVYWFALSTRSQSLTPLIIPLMVQYFLGEEIKGSALGNIRLWALMTAVLVQALIGLISDRSTARMGRRRPFILAGTLGEILVFTLIGFSAGLSGDAGYRVLFVLYILSSISSNTAQTATQALIPDRVPETMRGRFSGVKTLFEVPFPLIFVALVIGPLASSGNLWGVLLTVIIVLAVCAAITMFTPEIRLEKPVASLDWAPFLRIVLMTAVFTSIILGMGNFVQRILRQPVDLTLWLQSALPAVVGVLAMVFTVGVGVTASLRIGIGREVTRVPSYTWWVINRLAFLAGSTNIGTFVLYFLQERFTELEGAKAAGPAASILLVVGAFILLTAVPGGFLADRYGKTKLIAIAGLLAAAGMGVVILIPNMTSIYIGGGIVGAGVGLFYSANWALGTELIPPGQAGRFLGISNVAGAGAGAIGAYIGGPIADSLGYTYILGIYTFLFLFSVAALLGVKEKPAAV